MLTIDVLSTIDAKMLVLLVADKHSKPQLEFLISMHHVDHHDFIEIDCPMKIFVN